jgi:hypothetical protein
LHPEMDWLDCGGRCWRHNPGAVKCKTPPTCLLAQTGQNAAPSRRSWAPIPHFKTALRTLLTSQSLVCELTPQGTDHSPDQPAKALVYVIPGFFPHPKNELEVEFAEPIGGRGIDLFMPATRWLTGRRAERSPSRCSRGTFSSGVFGQGIHRPGKPVSNPLFELAGLAVRPGRVNLPFLMRPRRWGH